VIYEVKLSARAKKNLKKLDKAVARSVTNWIEKNLVGCSNPRIKGKQMSASHNEKWRYRIGDYRLNVKVQDEELIILAITIGHRKEVYDNL
jgi:mRNA interferase RelE/StbE